MEVVEPFAREIWKVCIECSNSTVSGNNKILINALNYFKTFAMHEKFMVFFQENLKDLFINLLIPNFKPSSEEQEIFESEPDCYVEALLDNSEVCKRSEMCAGFLKTLCKFHTDNVQEMLQNIISDYYGNIKFSSIENRKFFFFDYGKFFLFY